MNNNNNIFNSNINLHTTDIGEIYNNLSFSTLMHNNLNDENNFQTFIDLDEKNLLENSNSEEILIDEKMKCLEFNNTESCDPLNEVFNSIENPKNNYLGKKSFFNKDEIFSHKKNRNYLNNYIFKISNEQIESNNYNRTSETSNSNHSIKEEIIYSNKRCDSFLIKFKSYLGKSFITYINNRLKKISKRKIKFFSFNYKRFTIIVSYKKNQEWLNEKIKNLMVLGDESNQEKNQKSLRSLYRKKEEEFNEIKALLELSYREIIEWFYSSNYFEEFKKDQRNLKNDENFKKIMNISLLEQNGFIYFLNTRKGNKERI